MVQWLRDEALSLSRGPCQQNKQGQRDKAIEARHREIQVQLPAPAIISDSCGLRFILAMSLRK